MKLYHRTKPENVQSILREGLRPSEIGIVYLSPVDNCVSFGKALLEVETGDNKLTSFEGCEEWEVLCWGAIPPEDIKEKQVPYSTPLPCKKFGGNQCALYGSPACHKECIMTHTRMEV